MTDREKITAVVIATAEQYIERDHSLTIRDSGIKILFTPKGEIKSIIRDGQSFKGEDESAAPVKSPVVCMYCKRVFREIELPPADAGKVSHGCCKACEPRMLEDMSR